MFFLYILKSNLNGSYYVGSCRDVVVRIALHNRGSVKATKRYLPWELVYKEEYESLKEARRRELQVKSWKSRAAINRLLEHSKS